MMEKGMVPVLVDPEGECLKEYCPDVLIDAIIAKQNLGTSRNMAPLTVALGPGFCAGKDVDVVIETSRGHNLGRIIREGMAKPDTGIPGMIGGYAKERVIHAPAEGRLYHAHEIGDQVAPGEIGKVIRSQKDLRLQISIRGWKNMKTVLPYPIKRDASPEACWKSYAGICCKNCNIYFSLHFSCT